MACVGNKAPLKMDSEMEEGEIVDDLSDISSEEEFLLRQRLEVLENYNNVLERKKAKRTPAKPGTKHRKEDALSYDLSEISATELEDYCIPHKTVKSQRNQKPHHRQKRKKEEANENILSNKDHKKKIFRPKKKLEVMIISESSEESDDEYRNRRKKLADAVVVHKPQTDKTSLSERLQKMLHGVNPEPMRFIIPQNKTNTYIISHTIEHPKNCSPISSQTSVDQILHSEIQDVTDERKTINCQTIDLTSSTNNNDKTVITVPSAVDTVDSIMKENQHVPDIEAILDKDSDDDIELLRQHALKTKTDKTKKDQEDILLPPESKILSEDEDSDTTELRLICLKSALLKKAIEMKRKQKLQKKLSQSSNIHDDSLENILLADKMNTDNNTDIESVDMDIGSDGEDKLKEGEGNFAKNTTNQEQITVKSNKAIPVLMVTHEDELEEDEDLLRAKLLTSLSKNLPNLINPNIIKSIESTKDTGQHPTSPKPPQPAVTVPEEKRFIISVESDSEGEHEATKNLTKMHMKLSEQMDFQQQLDLFLKSTRKEVENSILPDVVQQPIPPKKNEKYVVKAVKNLPKSEQIEYKNLVKRMAELEKIKQARQSTMRLNKVPLLPKDTLKPRNITINSSSLFLIDSLEEKIKKSRKNIAEESAKMLKLKEEGTKLTQKFKIVATELRNLKTAIALNKKQQRTVQNCLTKIRVHHQMLLKSSLSSTHSKSTALSHLSHVNPRLQKENNPKDIKSPKEIPKDGYKNPAVLKAVKIGIRNDIVEPKEAPKPLVIYHPRLSIEVDITSNKKVVTMDNNENADKNKESKSISEDLLESNRHASHPVVEKGGTSKENVKIRRESDDYKSPLDAFSTWEEDPNAILCPFEVCGDCKDAECKYLHTNTRSK